MQETIARYVGSLTIGRDKDDLFKLFNALGDRLSSQALKAGTLAIATVTQNVKLTNTIQVVANGVYVSRAAADPIFTLTAAHSVAINQFNVLCLYCDSAGTVSGKMGIPGASAAAVKFPEAPVGQAMIGFLMISAGANVFTGGITALTGGTVTVTYVDVTGAFDPTVILS